jgi:subtilase family serine protease
MIHSLLRSFSRTLTIVAAVSVLAACSKSTMGMTPAVNNAPQSGTAKVQNTGTRFLQSTSAVSDSTDFQYNVKPFEKQMDDQRASSPDGLPPPSVCAAYYGLACYTPAEMRSAYNVPSSLDGSGQTIVIVDAYGSPTIQKDLKYFDKYFKLPDTTLNVIYPSGPPAQADNGWAGETSLDVEWAHAIAPGATIDLVVSPTNYSSDLNTAEQYVIDNHLGGVMSMSFGAPEQAIPGGAANAHLKKGDSLYQAASAANITSIASAGDTGADFGTGTAVANFPSSDPNVLAIGGTNLFMSDTGAYQSETVWNDTDPSTCPFGCSYGAFGATGGAPSIIFSEPAYQQENAHQTARTVADVSYNASVYTAVMVAESFRGNGTHLYFTGGTSAGSPQWAGVITLANQAAGHQLGNVNFALYKLAKHGGYDAAFHDITLGNNSIGGPGFSAASGWDIPTGIGSPNVANLINALAH